jgi:CRISPR-associated endonuclease/helicase Cas3
MAIWLIARALVDGEARKKLPRRLVYVVDRRAVVDQATAEAEKMRAALDGAAGELKVKLGLIDRSLPISTLRGQYADNREWLADPAAPAIIVGTVDMIGSRLLFEGYGVSRKMRPYHAGLLGADALIVLDEAHLVPPFEKLLEAIEKGGAADYGTDRQGALGPRDPKHREIIPPFRLLSLSATGRDREGGRFQLVADDHKDEIVSKRLDARKAVTIQPLKDKQSVESAPAETAWRLSESGANAIRCLIYCDGREAAQKVFDDLSNCAAPEKKGAEPKANVELFTGARRYFEREETIRRLAPLGFIAGQKNQTGRPAFLVATSAAEVGVDLDADHMVCDLVAWERMVQRLGRVNRRGEGAAKVIVIDPGPPPAPKKPEEPNDAEKRALLNYGALAVINHLRKTDGNAIDASPASLVDLKSRAASNDGIRKTIDAATTPAPLRPALTRALVDAWSMTSLEEHTGRPEIDPWLRGWAEKTDRQTAVVWRAHLPIRKRGEEATKKEVEDYFEAAPPHISEKLEMETYAVADWLIKRAGKFPNPGNSEFDSSDADGEASGQSSSEFSDEMATVDTPERALRTNDIVAFALSPARELKRSYRLSELDGDTKGKDALEKELAGAILIVDARFGGLSGGLLAEKDSSAPRTADDGGEWLPAPTGKDGKPELLIKFRVRRIKGEGAELNSSDEQSNEQHWRETFRFAKEIEAEGKAVSSLVVEKWRGASTREDERSVSRPQSLAEHQSWAEAKAKKIAAGVGLQGAHADALAIAARLHDEGKKAKRWQRAFNAHKADKALERPLAKTKGPIDFKLLDGYRHEFGSLPYAQKDGALTRLPEDLQELALHLIASHHGGARPVIDTRSCEDAPPSALQQRARDVALRFARLQKQWGPWGLAWWEALLRAADQQASRDNDEAGRKKAGSA